MSENDYNSTDLSKINLADILNSTEDDFNPLTIGFDIDEIDDDEYQIPQIKEPPSLESILNETDDRVSVADVDSLSWSQGFPSTLKLAIEESETQSVASQRSKGPTTTSNSTDKHRTDTTAFIRHSHLKGISTQIASAADRANAGSATSVAISGLLIVVGTTRGRILVFDNRQSLRWCLSDAEDGHEDDNSQGSVSSLALNSDSSRLLAGYARSDILMFDLNNGKCIRNMTDVHTSATAVLSLHFTDLPNLALCADSGGSVFELNFKRTLGIRSCDTKCLFSGSRGEVCTIAPLLLYDVHHALKGAVIVALATLSKVIVISIRPQTRVILVRPLLPGSDVLPLLAWQLVFVQNRAGGKNLDPVLAFAKNNVIHFYQISVDPIGQLRLSVLNKIEVKFSLLSIHWLNSWTLALLDTSEILHLVDIHTQVELESLDVSHLALVYETSHFKGLATGGNVSKALAKAGERACYNTVVSQGSQLVILNARSLHAINIRPWAERLNHLVKQRKYLTALSLGLSFYEEPKAVLGLKGSRERRQDITRGKVVQILEAFIQDMANPIDDIPAIVHYAISLHSPGIIFTKLWDAIQLSNNSSLKMLYFQALEPHILSDQLKSTPPSISQQFVSCYEQAGKFQALEACILHLDIQSLDLHQTVQICWTHSLYDAIIFIYNVAFNDYSTPIHDLVTILETALSSGRKLTGKEVELGNKLLVYISCCLAGRSYPVGDVPKDIASMVKHDVFKSLTSLHSKDADDQELAYPYLRTLLHFDTREFLNVVSLAFTEPEFTTELGFRQRQRLVDILFQVMVHNPGFSAVEVGAFFTFLAGQLSRPNSGIHINPELFHPVFENLTDSSDKSFFDQHEQSLLDLIRTAGLQKYPRELLLIRCRNCKFYRVSELLYEQSGEWDQAFLCYLNDPLRKKQVFPFLKNIFLVYRNNREISRLVRIICDRIRDLLSFDRILTSNLIVDHLMSELPNMLKVLINDDRLKLDLLDSVLFSRTNLTEDHEKLLSSYIDLYVSLHLKLHPDQVVEVLSKFSDYYEPNQMLSLVKNYMHVEAEAFLLEAKNCHTEAFKKLSQRLESVLLTSKNNSYNNLEKIENLVTASIGVIQRSYLKYDENDVNQMWSVLLDLFISCKNVDILPDYVKVKLLQQILSASMGYSNPSCILDFILEHSAYLDATLKDIRTFLAGMLSNWRYEERAVTITQKVLNHDLHIKLKELLRMSSRGVRAATTNPCSCAVCGKAPRSADVNAFLLYPCGHCAHDTCAYGCQCPICLTVAVDQMKMSKEEKKHVKLNLGDFEKLKTAAPPPPDLETLFK